MTDAEWAQVRASMPVPAWLEGRGGRPEAFCHREMVDAVRYVVGNGAKWRGASKKLIAELWRINWHTVGAVRTGGLERTRGTPALAGGTRSPRRHRPARYPAVGGAAPGRAA